MDFDESPADAAFRKEARTWLESHAVAKGSPDDFSVPYAGNPRTLEEFEVAEQAWVDRNKWWQGELYNGGWAGITWPKIAGGRAGTALEAAIFAEEQADFGVSNGAFSVGIGMAGPTIINHGNDAQKERYLTAMLRGEEVWCQLFSEPGAGSDLAGLSTRAVRDGDQWIVNGQKVWTSSARQSDWAILLARTDADQPKHRGITFFLVDMRTPGIDVRPLRQINGGYHFNEVFLTDVAIPVDNVVGEVNDGWRVAMTTLMNERNLIGGQGTSGARALIGLAQRRGVAADPAVRQRLASIYAREQTLKYMSYRTRTAIAQGKELGPESSASKLANALLRSEMADYSLLLAGPGGMLVEGEGATDEGEWASGFLFSRASRIGGGTDEVQRNVISERVLGMPREPSDDRVVPFSELATRRASTR